MQLLSKQELLKATNLEKSGLRFSAGFLMWLFNIDKLNKLYSDAFHKDAIPFINSALDILNVQLNASKRDMDKIPKEGPFVVTSNHPFGLLDGMLMLKVLHEVRPDAKVMANFLLQRIQPLKDHFIPVNPFEQYKEGRSSYAGIKAALKHLKDGHPMGLFPAGEVSTKQPGSKKISDRDWQATAIRLVKKSGVPVVPMHFSGQNSALFHLIGKIHPLLRTACLPNELFTKRDKTITVKIGKPISPKEIQENDDIEQLGRFLKAKTYAIGTDVNVKKFFRPNLNQPKKPEPIAPPVDQNLLVDELLRLPSDNLVLEQGDYQVYVGASNQIPHALNEIGRLREETFREVGEGSNLSIDVDEFDLYYLHMFIWNKVELRIAGAYRIGQGDKIFPQFGKKGFYTESLFKFKKEFYPILKNAVELGRSFIIKEYQNKPLPLFILWRGILHFLIQNPQYRYIIGPVTISNEYSGLSKWLIIEFIKRHFFDEKLSAWVKPRTAFSVKRKDRDENLLDAINSDDIKRLDNLISDIEPSGFRVPVLLKKYLKQNARIIAFNIDPKFNNALDGLMILDMLDLPQGTIDKLKMEMKEQSTKIS